MERCRIYAITVYPYVSRPDTGDHLTASAMNNLPALDLVLAAFSQCDSTLGSLREIASRLDPEQAALVLEQVDLLAQALSVLNPEDEFSLPDRPSLSKAVPRSQVIQSGLASTVVEMRNRLSPIAQIATATGLNEHAIRRFLKFYDSLPPIERRRCQATSVFDTTNRLEELFQLITRRLHVLETGDEEAHSRMVSELRQTIQLAATISEKIGTWTRVNALTELVKEVLMDELPHKRRAVSDRINKILSTTS